MAKPVVVSVVPLPPGASAPTTAKSVDVARAGKMSTLLRQGVEQDGVGVGLGVGVGVGVGVTGGDGMKFVAISAPPPHAVSANAPAPASRRLEKCRTLM